MTRIDATLTASDERTVLEGYAERLLDLLDARLRQDPEVSYADASPMDDLTIVFHDVPGDTRLVVETLLKARPTLQTLSTLSLRHVAWAAAQPTDVLSGLVNDFIATALDQQAKTMLAAEQSRARLLLTLDPTTIARLTGLAAD